MNVAQKGIQNVLACVVVVMIKKGVGVVVGISV